MAKIALYSFKERRRIYLFLKTLINGYNARIFYVGAFSLKILRFLLILSPLFLQACHYNEEIKASKLAELTKRKAARDYNILLGMGYLKQGDNPRAKFKLVSALNLDPSSAEANSALAYFYEKTAETETAANYYAKALSLAPKSGAQLNNYGAFLCRSGKYKEALSYFLKAVKDLTYLNTAAVYENAGLCAKEIPDDKKAEVFFAKALNQDPRRDVSLYELVMLKLKHGQYELALNDLEKHSQLTYASKNLLNLGLIAAAQSTRYDIESKYKIYLNRLNSGVKNEYQRG